jgi:hypothetical protein
MESIFSSLIGVYAPMGMSSEAFDVEVYSRLKRNTTRRVELHPCNGKVAVKTIGQRVLMYADAEKVYEACTLLGYDYENRDFSEIPVDEKWEYFSIPMDELVAMQ